MTTDLERDSASLDRIRKWLARTLEGDAVDRLAIRHDTGAEVATMRGDEGGPFEHADGALDELAAAIADRVLEDAIGLGGVQRYVVIAYGADKVIGRLTLRENADASAACPAIPSTVSRRPRRAFSRRPCATWKSASARTPPSSRTSSRCRRGCCTR